MNNKMLLTVVIVLILAFGVGFALLSFSDQGVIAEIVDVQVDPSSPRQATVTMCAPPGGSLAGSEGGPTRAVVRVGESTELLDQRKSSPANLRPSDLAAGQQVRLWTNDTMLLTEPPQLTATRIAVMANPVAGQSICAR